VQVHDHSERPISPELLGRIEVLRGRDCHVFDLPGGLTNRNYKVVTAEATYVVRVSPPPGRGLSIDREHEYRNSVIAASTAVGAPVIDWLPDDGAMVLGYIDGVTFTDASLAAPGNVARVAAACRRLHDGPRFVNAFDMFETQQGYLRRVLEHGYRLPGDYLDHGERFERIRGALAVRAEPVVACHNDLLAGNLVDDGERVRLIDYEYAGNNDACFELGNIWSECHLSLDGLEELVTAYYGRPRPSRLARARLQGLMSQYGWTLWASIQAATSHIDFDYWSWGMEKYERAVAAFRGPDLEALIEQVQKEDRT
jgi:thiamine kinase-like enzyme